MLLVATDYPFLEIVGTMIIFFAWVAWFWALIAIISDVFRRDDLSGWGKAGWTLLVIVVPFLGVLIYLAAHGSGMSERSAKQARAQKAEFDAYVRETAATGGPAADIERAKALLDSGAISQAEFEEMKRKALA
jgi:Short C-terminal domain/Phospholipase_D-nuclease N-terminal